jgi:hypothetical protein
MTNHTDTLEIARTLIGCGFESGHMVSEEAAKDLLAQFESAISSAQQVRQEPVAEMVYFRRVGSMHEDCIPVLKGTGPQHVNEALITRIEPLVFAAPALSSEAGQQEAKPKCPLDRWLVKARNLGYESIDQALNAAPPQLEMPQGSSYGDTLDMLYAAWHREAPGDTLHQSALLFRKSRRCANLTPPPQAKAQQVVAPYGETITPKELAERVKRGERWELDTQIVGAAEDTITYTVNGVVMSQLEYIDYLHGKLAGRME